MKPDFHGGLHLVISLSVDQEYACHNLEDIVDFLLFMGYFSVMMVLRVNMIINNLYLEDYVELAI